MKKQIVVLGLVILLLVMGSSAVVAGGAKNATLVLFEIQKMIAPGVYDDYFVYCEGYFMRTGSGIVHEWRDNPECLAYPEAFIPSASLHLVFKPAEKFDSPDCDDKSTLYWSGLWSIDETYQDLDLPNEVDDANLADFLGEENVDFWQVCIYAWE
jgi:hypothetical protein